MKQDFDCAIVGGGVAGLALSILLAKANKKVILFEKEAYPFHKVCGEYISKESIPFLERLGVDFNSQSLPKISNLLLSSPLGIAIKRPLDIGGLGLSRYQLDFQLYQLALKEGVEIKTKTKVQKIIRHQDNFLLKTSKKDYPAKLTVAAFGKNSNIDVQLGRNYKSKKESDLFIAVKYHIMTDFDKSCVEMHNFKGGYCGLSAVEDNLVNMSYISKVSNLKKTGSIGNMEKEILSKNPYLENYFQEAKFVFHKPLTIAHLYFEIKEPVSNHLLMLGDAAGNIAPLSGNGMSMALNSSKIAFESVLNYLNGDVSFKEMEKNYQQNYRAAFSKRIKMAKYLNLLFGNTHLTDWAFRFLKTCPFLIDTMSKKIHGDVF